MRTPKTEIKKQEAVMVGERIKMIRKEAGMSLQEIAERLNRDYGANTNKGMISKYENGIHEPSAGTVYCLSNILGVSPDYLMCRSELKCGGTQSAAVSDVGQIITVYSRYNPKDGGTVERGSSELIPSQWLIGGHEFFGLRISGSELAPRYYDGDIIIFERRGKVQRDRVGLVSIGGKDAMICHIIRKRNGKSIVPLDRRLDELFFTTEQLEKEEVLILGAAVQVRRMEYNFQL